MGSSLTDLAIYINLDRRTDRRAHMETQFAREGISVLRLAAVDGQGLPPRCFPKTPGLGWTAGALGCLLSHSMAIELALVTGCGSLLVLEDDAVLPRGFAARTEELFELLPEDWAMVTFGGWHRYPTCRVWNGVSRLNHTLCSHAYILRGDGLLVARDMIHKRQSYIDSMLAACQSVVPSYCADEIVVPQLEGYSDCWDRHMGVSDGRVAAGMVDR